VFAIHCSLELAADISSALLMGVLKAIFLYTTGGTLDNIFEYWVHVWEK
jgi:hypothetical protein